MICNEFVIVQSQADLVEKRRKMFTFLSIFSIKSIWRIRHTGEIRSIFEVCSEQLHEFLRLHYIIVYFPRFEQINFYFFWKEQE